MSVNDAAFYNRSTGELETVADMERAVMEETQNDRIERKLDEVLEKMKSVEKVTMDVMEQVKPTLDELMNSSLIKMLGIKKAK
jgi:tetrahydromethanopterin S-methyltransferase subunit B